MDVVIGRAVLTSLGTAGICSAACQSPQLAGAAARIARFFLIFFFDFLDSGELAGASRERDYPGTIPPELLVAMESPLKSGNS